MHYNTKKKKNNYYCHWLFSDIKKKQFKWELETIRFKIVLIQKINKLLFYF